MKGDAKFSEDFERKVRKFIRVNRLFSKKDKIFVSGSVNKFLLKKILGKFPVEYVPKARAKKVFIEWSMDDELNSFLEQFVLDKKKEKTKAISFLKVVTDEDIIRFAKIHKLSFRPRKKNKKMMELVDKMREYQGTDKTLLGNISVLNRLTKDKFKGY